MRNIICLLSVMMLFVSILPESAQAETSIEGATVEYRAEGVVMKGYFAYDKKIRGKRPGVLVVHE